MFKKNTPLIFFFGHKTTQMNFKDIHIGQLIEQAVAERGIKPPRICNFLKCTEADIGKMYRSKSIDTEFLLKWSKLLEYDFFRIFTQHLILYAPVSAVNGKTEKQKIKKEALPRFRKNIYTREIIVFILEQVSSGKMTKKEVSERYKIPKTTLYKWIEKYGKRNEDR